MGVIVKGLEKYCFRRSKPSGLFWLPSSPTPFFAFPHPLPLPVPQDTMSSLPLGLHTCHPVTFILHRVKLMVPQEIHPQALPRSHLSEQMFRICCTPFLGFLWPDSRKFHTFHFLWELEGEGNLDG